MLNFTLLLRNNVINLLLTFLLFVIFADPSNKIFHVKDSLFLLILSSWLITTLFFTYNLPRKITYILIAITIFFPLYGLSVMGINGIPFQISTPYFKSFFFFGLLLIIINLNINITQRFHYMSFMISVIVFTCLILFYFARVQFDLVYNYLVINKQVAVARGYFYHGHEMFTLFYKTSPLLLFPLGYYFQNLYFVTGKKSEKIYYLSAIGITSIPFIFSSTRANIIIFFTLVVIYSMHYIFIKNQKLFFASLILFAFCAICLIPSFSSLFSINETSNNIKFIYILDYMNLFKSDYKILFFGQGFNSCFHSTFYNTNIYVTELSYLEFIRIFGLPNTILFLIILFYPIFVFYKNYEQYYAYRYVPISYTCYLIIAGTNPLLLSSTGMIAIVYVYSIMVINSPFFVPSKYRRAIVE